MKTPSDDPKRLTRSPARRFVGVDLQIAGCGVDAVAEGSGAAAPFAAGGFAFRPGDDPIDDGGPFELREHAEHLHHHPTRSGRGVERFRRAAERHGHASQVSQRGGPTMTLP
jgi:hypothetical protein